MPADAGFPAKAIVPVRVLVLPGRKEWVAFTSFNTPHAFGSGKSRVPEIRTLLYHWIDRLL